LFLWYCPEIRKKKSGGKNPEAKIRKKNNPEKNNPEDKNPEKIQKR